MRVVMGNKGSTLPGLICESTWPGLIDLNGPCWDTMQIFDIYKDWVTHNHEYMLDLNSIFVNEKVTQETRYICSSTHTLFPLSISVRH